MSGPTPPGVYRVNRPVKDFVAVSNSFARSKLKPGAKALGLYLASHEDGYLITWARIRAEIGMSNTAIQKAIADLEEAGHLRREVIYKAGFGAVGTRFLFDDSPGQAMIPVSGITESGITESGVQKKTNSSEKTNDLEGTTSARATAQALDAEFETWWESWPKKTAKEAARKAYRAARKTTSVDVLQAAVAPLGARYAQLPKDRRQYVVYPATYLNQHRWEDPPEEVVRLDGNRVQTGGAEAYQPGLESRRNEENWQRLYAENPERFSVADMGLDDDGPAF